VTRFLTRFPREALPKDRPRASDEDDVDDDEDGADPNGDA